MMTSSTLPLGLLKAIKIINLGIISNWSPDATQHMFTVSGRTFYDNLFLAAMKEQLKQEITKRRADDRKKSRREARMERQGSNKQQDKARKKSKGKGRDETEIGRAHD